MNSIVTFLTGKKTYVAAAVTIVGALYGVSEGAVTVEAALQAISTAIIGASLRHGISTGK